MVSNTANKGENNKGKNETTIHASKVSSLKIGKRYLGFIFFIVFSLVSRVINKVIIFIFYGWVWLSNNLIIRTERINHYLFSTLNFSTAKRTTASATFGILNLIQYNIVIYVKNVFANNKNYHLYYTKA